MSANRSVGRTSSTIGMMEGAFFVSRTDLLQWVNNLLQVNLAKVEQCASGAIYCQIIDACHPNSVAMRKVNWMAKSDHEFIPNYKVLQVAFDKNSIERYIDVDKLIRAKYQDNLEFLQFMKCYWEREGGAGRRDYEPCQAREGKSLPPWAQRLGGPPVGSKSVEKENLRPKAAPVKSNLAPEKRLGTTGRPITPGAAMKPTGGARTPRSQDKDVSDNVSLSADLCGEAKDSASRCRVSQEMLAMQDENKRLDEENRDFRATLEGLERERDYYFRKLRLVEMFCTQQQAHLDPNLTAEKVLDDITGMLYAEGNDEDDDEQDPQTEQQTA